MGNLSVASWKEFRIGDLFEKRTVRGVPKSIAPNMLSFRDDNGHPVYGQNIKWQYPYKVMLPDCYLWRLNGKPILAYASSVGEIGMIEEDFYRTGDNGAFQALIPNENLNKRALLYMLTVLQKHFNNFNYGTSMAKVMDIKICIPAKEDGTPNWDYMAECIKELEAERIKELEAYLLATGLNDYELTERDKQIFIRFLQQEKVSRLMIFNLLSKFEKER